MSAAQRTDVAVVGGGIIGLAVAWAARRRGLEVTVLERDRAGAGAARVAAGMLAPVAEVEVGAAGRALLELGSASAALWPGFAAELERARAFRWRSAARRPCSSRATPTRPPSSNASSSSARRWACPCAACARARRASASPRWRRRSGWPSLSAASARSIRAAFWRRCAAPVSRTAWTCARGRRLRASSWTRAASASPLSCSATAHGSPPNGWCWLRGRGRRTSRCCARERPRAIAWPRVRSCGRSRARSCTCAIRRDRACWQRVVRFVGGYLVPRGDGRYVLGATVEDSGFDAAPTAGAVLPAAVRRA